MSRAPMMHGMGVLMALTATPVLADAIRCDGPGGSPSVVLDASIMDDRRSLVVSRLDADLGDLGGPISTAGDEPGLIAEQESGDERLTIDITDPTDTWIVLRLRLVRDVAYDRLMGDESDEDAPAVVAGTLSIMGAGAWTVSCTGW